jgi:hypothetical protein
MRLGLAMMAMMQLDSGSPVGSNDARVIDSQDKQYLGRKSEQRRRGVSNRLYPEQHFA